MHFSPQWRKGITPIYVHIYIYFTDGNSTISNVALKISPVQIYGDARLIYIRYDASIEAKPSGQQKIGVS